LYKQDVSSNFTTHHCSSLKAQLEFEIALGVSGSHKIPLSKILHTLGRKGFSETIIWERNVDNCEYKAECSVYADASRKVDRLHFISSPIDSINELRQHPQAYGGYCDLRPDTRSVVAAYITQNAAVRLEKETYAFLCCSMSHSVEVRNESGEVVLTPQIITFPYMEKDRKGVMCSQAALLPLFEYWNFLRPGMFSVSDAIALNRKCGVSDAEEVDGRGLTLQEIGDFLNKEGAPNLIINYSPTPTEGTAPQKESVQDIYGFVESGFPVVAVVAWPTVDDEGNSKQVYHALLFLGHTYDRNSWIAMADIGYFGRKGVGGHRYHANTTWIRHFLVHDDNFGPYYFLPTNELEKIVLAGVVVLPQSSISTRPSEVAEAVFEMLTTPQFSDALGKGIADPLFLHQNKQWLTHFLDHLKVKCGDGLVLRPVLLSRNNVLGRYRKHEFHMLLGALLEDKEDQYFWYVELTWPDIYCHRQLCCGAVILDPNDKQPIFVHIPGMCAVFQGGAAIPIIAKEEDMPRKHFKED